MTSDIENHASFCLEALRRIVNGLDLTPRMEAALGVALRGAGVPQNIADELGFRGDDALRFQQHALEVARSERELRREIRAFLLRNFWPIDKGFWLQRVRRLHGAPDASITSSLDLTPRLATWGDVAAALERRIASLVPPKLEKKKDAKPISLAHRVADLAEEKAAEAREFEAKMQAEHVEREKARSMPKKGRAA